jgi:cysteine desulfurase
MKRSILNIAMFWKKLFGAGERVYADAAAATPLSSRAHAELLRLLPLFGNPGALHREALDAKRELERARERIASVIGAHADEIIFTASGTEANNLALQGVLRPLLLQHGEVHAITSAVEHQSVLVPLRALEREGLYLTVLPVDSEGLVNPRDLAEAINEETALVSVQLVNSEVGTIEPLREIAKVVRHAKKLRGSNPSEVRESSAKDSLSSRAVALESPLHGSAASPQLPLYLHTDASQAPLWLPVGVEQIGVDLLTLDGQKVLGPKGVGCLYIRRGVEIEPVLWGGSQERGLRGGTQNAPLAGSFAVALEDAAQGVEERTSATAAVRDYLWAELKAALPGAVLHGPEFKNRAANNLNISIPGLSGELAVISLDALGVAASTRSACNTGDEAPSHVIEALGTPRELQKSAVRITLLPGATRAEVLRIVAALKTVVQRQQNMV